MNGPVIASAFSNQATAILLSAPTNLAATLQFGPQVSLAWTDTATNETGFLVQRSDNGGAFGTIALLAANTGTGPVSYVDITAQPGATYVYQVSAVNGWFTSANSNAVTVTTPVAPAAPTKLLAKLVTGPRVNLSFKDNATNETGFQVQRSDNGSPFTTIATLPPKTGTGNVAYTDATVKAGNTYTYQVRAVNGVSPSGFSNKVSVTAPVALVAAGAAKGDPAATKLTAQVVQPIVDEAIARWSTAGLSASDIALLRNTRVTIGNLSGNMLAATAPGTRALWPDSRVAGPRVDRPRQTVHTIWLDDDAAGWGWYVDRTPKLDEEFTKENVLQASPQSAAFGRMDLLTAVMHEMGHILGRSDQQNVVNDLMFYSLAAGVREVPSSSVAAQDAVFAGIAADSLGGTGRALLLALH